MQLTVFTEAGAFLEKVRPILEKNEAANSLILSNLLRLAENPTAPTSNRSYQKMGYKHILDYDELVFEQ